jgi:DNA-binding PadR family transcriptional regulator
VRRADRDVTALTVLALLLTGPRHTYEMHLMVERTAKTFVTGLPRSLYHAVDRLLRDELVEVAGTRREGGRPERTVYRLTGAGRVRLRAWVDLLLRTPDDHSALLGPALTYAGCLPPAAVATALRARHDELSRRTDAAAAALAAVRDRVPRILLVEGEYEVNRLTAEREWIAGLVADVESGRLTWPDDPAAISDIDVLLREEP